MFQRLLLLAAFCLLPTLPENSSITNLEGGWAISIVIDPSNPDVVLAALHGGGVFRSSDAGLTWEARNNGLTERTVIPLMIDEHDPRTIYAGTESGIFKTVDGGSRWFSISSGLGNRNIWSLARDPRDPERLYAGSSGGGVYRTDSGGAAWIALNKGLTNHVVWPIVLDPTNPDTVYVGTIGGGVFRSDDRGGEWRSASDSLPNRRIYSLAILPDGSSLFAGTSDGIYETDDGGKQWRALSARMSGKMIFSLHVLKVAQQERMYAATSSGLYVSTDRGNSWSQLANDQQNQSVWSFASNSTRPEVMLVGTLGDAVYRSANGGVTWSSQKGAFRQQLVYSLAYDGRTVYAGCAGSGVVKASAANVSNQRDNGLTKPVVKCLVASSKQPGLLYAGGEEQFMGGRGGVFKSIDSAKTWTEVSKGSFEARVFSLALDPNDIESVYAGADAGRLYVTHDGGKSWSEVGHNILASIGTEISQYQQTIHSRPINAIAIDPRSSKSIYVATDSGIFKTLDGGFRWQDISEGMPDRRVRTMIQDPLRPDYLYAGTGDLGSGGALFRTRDAGRTWQSVMRGEWILSLALDPADPDCVYAGSENGTYMSQDAGATFHLLSGGPTHRYVLAMVSDTGHGILYNGTEGNGIFATSLRSVVRDRR